MMPTRASWPSLYDVFIELSQQHCSGERDKVSNFVFRGPAKRVREKVGLLLYIDVINVDRIRDSGDMNCINVQRGHLEQLKSLYLSSKIDGGRMESMQYLIEQPSRTTSIIQGVVLALSVMNRRVSYSSYREDEEAAL